MSVGRFFDCHGGKISITILKNILYNFQEAGSGCDCRSLIIYKVAGYVKDNIGRIWKVQA